MRNLTGSELAKEAASLAEDHDRLLAENRTLREQALLLEAKCAEMRKGFEEISGFSRGDIGCQQLCDYVNEVAERCISDQCGVGWLSPVKADKLMAFARFANGCIGVPDWVRDKAKQALEACK